MDTNIFAWIDINRDFYPRYYHDFPKIAVGLAAAALLLSGIFGGRWMRRRRARARQML